MNDAFAAGAGEDALREFVDAIFTLRQSLDPTAEKAVREALGRIAGVRNVSLANKTLAVEYDPTGTREEEIARAITGAGGAIVQAAVTPASPLTDALAGQLAPGKLSPNEESQ